MKKNSSLVLKKIAVINLYLQHSKLDFRRSIAISIPKLGH